MKDRYNVIIADDHAMFREGLKRILLLRPDVEVVGEARSGLDLLNLLRKLDADLIVLDISMPELRGLETIPEIKRLHRGAKILVLTMHRDAEYLFQAISAGASGYLLKEDAERDLFSAIDTIKAGGTYLSHLVADDSLRDWTQSRGRERKPDNPSPLSVRERQVLKMITEGKTSKEIGDLLCISYRTVECHRANIMAKLNVKKTADLICLATEKGYV